MPPRIDPERVERPGLPSTILGPPAGRSLPFAGLLLAAACSGGPPADGPRHPDPVRIVGGSSAEVELPVAPAPVPDDPLRGAGGEREAMGSTDPAMVIGRLEGPPEAEVFGRIQDVTRDARGRLLVLDAQARDLRVFDTSGAWIQTVGGPGPGPGELLHPRAVAADDHEDAVYIFGATGRVVRFLPSGDTLRFADELDFGLEILDACVLGNRIVVHGTRPGGERLLHVYDREGAALRSFGRLYRTTNRIVRHQLSRGSLACVSSTGRVVLAPRLLPLVRAYSLDGVKRWTVRLQGFRPPDLRVTPAGGSIFRMPDGGHHLISGLVASGNEASLLLQVASVGGGGRSARRGRDLATYALNPQDGRPVSVGPRSRILAWDDHQIITARTDPFPRLTVVNQGIGSTAGVNP